jgi:hypothetical protein
MRPRPSHRRAPRSTSSRGLHLQGPLKLELEKLLPSAHSARTSPGSRRQPLSHLLPVGWRELHLYGPTGTGVAPRGPLMWPPPAQAPLGI